MRNSNITTSADEFFETDIFLCFLGENPVPCGYVRSCEDAIRFATDESCKNKTIRILTTHELKFKSIMDEFKELKQLNQDDSLHHET